jgi:hypothetical protein
MKAEEKEEEKEQESLRSYTHAHTHGFSTVSLWSLSCVLVYLDSLVSQWYLSGLSLSLSGVWSLSGLSGFHSVWSLYGVWPLSGLSAFSCVWFLFGFLLSYLVSLVSGFSLVSLWSLWFLWSEYGQLTTLWSRAGGGRRGEEDERSKARVAKGSGHGGTKHLNTSDCNVRRGVLLKAHRPSNTGRKQGEKCA